MGEFTVENICKIFSEESYKSIMQSATALYINKSNALLRGNKTYISRDCCITPFLKDGNVMVPVEFFALSIKASYEKKDEHLYCIKRGDKVLLLSEGENSCSIKSGIVYASVELLCSTFGQHLHIEENGIIIYSDTNILDALDWQKNMHLMRKICESYMFDDVSGEEIAEKIKCLHPNCHHPRLVLTNEKIIKMRELLKNKDSVYLKMYDNLKQYADKFLEEKSSGYELRDDIRLLYVCRENGYRMLVCALMYLFLNLCCPLIFLLAAVMPLWH